jgi:hypothetical protein
MSPSIFQLFMSKLPIEMDDSMKYMMWTDFNVFGSAAAIKENGIYSRVSPLNISSKQNEKGVEIFQVAL